MIVISSNWTTFLHRRGLEVFWTHDLSTADMFTSISEAETTCKILRGEYPDLSILPARFKRITTKWAVKDEEDLWLKSRCTWTTKPYRNLYPSKETAREDAKFCSSKYKYVKVFK